MFAVVLLLAGKAHFLPLDRARGAITDWAQPALQKMNAPVVAASNWLSGVRHFFDVYSENQRLREENAALRQWQGAATMLDARVKRYQKLLNSVSDPAATAVAARVIGHSSRPFSETIILNAGAKDRIKPGETVADARGVLGRIYLTGQHTSWVILLTDLNSSVPVSIEPSNDQAILAGDNTEAPVLGAVAQGAKLKEGEEVVTSGNGGLMPPGLPIGTLLRDGDAFRVALFADPGNADDVRIMDFHQEQMPAPKPDDLPAIAAGLTPSPPPASAPAVSPMVSGSSAVVNVPPAVNAKPGQPLASSPPTMRVPAGISNPTSLARLPASRQADHSLVAPDSDHRAASNGPAGVTKSRKHTARTPIELERAREKAAMAREGISASTSSGDASPGLAKKHGTRQPNANRFDDDMPPPPPPPDEEQDR